jgi:4-diphosphocytidyl-2-C-methyl-D-erythritol kinase
MDSIELIAPAKVNLFLHVLGRRKDGYHNILTLFERISLSDSIKISKIPKGITVSSDKFITKNPKDNLVYKAAKLIMDFKKSNGGLKIEIRKKIPIAGGLAGGSSDAASVLNGAAALFDLKITRNELMRLAGRLGADVPFFMLDVPYAIGRSRGDRLKKASCNATLWHLIVCPPLAISAKDAYEAFDSFSGSPSARTGDFALTKQSSGAKISTR